MSGAPTRDEREELLRQIESLEATVRILWKDRRDLWVRCPDGSFGNCAGHEVTEHEDGAVTVSPSILVREGDRELWHGWLERGVWRSA